MRCTSALHLWNVFVRIIRTGSKVVVMLKVTTLYRYYINFVQYTLVRIISETKAERGDDDVRTM